MYIYIMELKSDKFCWPVVYWPPTHGTDFASHGFSLSGLNRVCPPPRLGIGLFSGTKHKEPFVEGLIAGGHHL